MFEIHATNPYDSIAKHHGIRSEKYAVSTDPVYGLRFCLDEQKLRDEFGISSTSTVVLANTHIMPIGNSNAYLATFEVQSIESVEPAID